MNLENVNLQAFIQTLSKKEIGEIYEKFGKNKIPTYTFSKITHKDLRKLFSIKRIFTHDVFNDWFSYAVDLKNEDVNFLKSLLDKEIDFIKIYNEEDLKIHFIALILNQINFRSIKNQCRDFYEEALSYKTKKFILTGNTDFFVAKGLQFPEKSYFFIQEFKKELQYSNPEPQLLAELIAAVELNNGKKIKGAYIVGATWNFVILEKIKKDSYQYYVSRNFYSTRMDDLKAIYKNLLFIKNEIVS